MVSNGYKSFKNCEQTILQKDFQGNYDIFNKDFHEKLLFETKDFLGCILIADKIFCSHESEIISETELIW